MPAVIREAVRRGGGVKRVGPAVGVALLTAAPSFAQSGTARHAPPQAFIAAHCIECHNSTDQTAAALYAGLFFDKLDVMRVADNPETWEKVVRKLGAGMMPPASEARPDPTAQAQFLAYLEHELDAHARAEPNPGRPALHRVNRAEYENAIRDLLALDIDATALLRRSVMINRTRPIVNACPTAPPVAPIG